MSDLVWTTKTPKEPGWHWAQESDTTRPFCAEVVEQDGALCILVVHEGQNVFLPVGDMRYWAGPIPEPDTILDESFWYCPKCRAEVTPQTVTFDLRHDLCFGRVECVMFKSQADRLASEAVQP